MHQRLIVLLAGLVFSSLGHAEVYCVDPTGTGGSGCGSTVFKTVGEVNNTLLLPGDQILFKRGGVWKEKLIAPSSGIPGNPITFGAYGEGDKPLLDGLVNPRNFGYSWVIAPDISAAVGGQVWYLTGGNPKLFTYWSGVMEESDTQGVTTTKRIRQVGRICDYDASRNLAVIGILANHEYSYTSRCPDNNGNWNMFVRIDEGNPADIPKEVLFGRDFITLIDTNEQNHLVFQDLAIRGGITKHGGPAVLFRNSDNLTFQNCEIYYSKKAMSTGEGSTSKPVASYAMFKIGTTAGVQITNDGSGKGNTATVYGAIVNTSGRDDIPVFQFDGIDDFLDAGTGVKGSFDFTDQLSVKTWYYHDTTTPLNHSLIQRQGVFALDVIGVDAATDRLTMQIVDATGTSHAVTTLQPYPNNTWHHVVANYGNGELSIYVNGKLDNSVAITGDVNQSATSVLIARSSADTYFKGMLDDVQLFSSALTADEVYRSYTRPYFLTNSVIQDNEIHDNLEGGIEISGKSSNNLIRRNNIHHNWTLGDSIGDRVALEITATSTNYPARHRSNNVFEFNDVHHNGGSFAITRDHVVAIYNGFQTSVRYNKIHDNQQGAFYFAANSEDSSFYYNQVYNNQTTNGRHIFLSGPNLRVYNNIFYNNYLLANSVAPYNYKSWRQISIEGPAKNAVIENNIFAGNVMEAVYNTEVTCTPEEIDAGACTPVAYACHQPFLFTDLGPNSPDLSSVYGHNLYFNNHASYRCYDEAGDPADPSSIPVEQAEDTELWARYSGGSMIPYANVEEFNPNGLSIDLGIGANPTNVFANPVAADFRLANAASPAVNMAEILAIPGDFAGNPIDFSGVEVTGTPDSGAFEFQPDTDGDGITDSLDNCPQDTNPNQTDIDGDTLGNVCDPEQLIITSIRSEDGWVKESDESTNVGGSSGSTGAGNRPIRFGDDHHNRQFKAIVSFDTSSMPAGSTVQAASLKLTRGKFIGNDDPYSVFGAAWVDLSTGGFGGNPALNKSDFEAPADVIHTGQLADDSALATAILDATGQAAIEGSSLIQLRIAFEIDDNNDDGNDYTGYYSGDNNDSGKHPRLVIQYTLSD